MEEPKKYSGPRYYQRAVWMARWFSITIVIGTYPINQSNSVAVTVLLAAAVGFNIATYFIGRRTSSVVSRNSSIQIIADNAFVLLLLLLTGGLNSPYFLYLLIIPLVSAYWYGMVGVTAMLFGELVALILVSRLLPQPPALSALRVLVIEVLSIINIGLLVIRLGRAQRLDKTVVMSVNTKIEAEREQLLALINSMDYCVIATDPGGYVRLYNAAALYLLQAKLDLKGKLLQEALPLTTMDGHAVDVIRQAEATSGVLRRRDLVYQLSPDEKMILSVTVTPVHPMHGAGDEGYILIIRDITKERSLEEQRDEFVAVASHELRTPLAIAEANLSTALLPGFSKIDPKAKDLLEQAHMNLTFMGDLIRDLAIVAQLQDNNIQPDFNLVDPTAIMERLVKDYQAEVDAKKLGLRLEVPKGLPKVFTSESRLHEILQNFITNAIKYTEKGEIVLAAEKAPGPKPGLVFSVSDSGIGISISDQRKLFDKFYRSEDYRTRKTSGTGLGLYIALKSAEMIGGRVWFKSKLNHGSTFYVEVHDSPGAKFQAV